MKEIAEWKFSGKSSLKSFSPTTPTHRCRNGQMKWMNESPNQPSLHWTQATQGTQHNILPPLSQITHNLRSVRCLDYSLLDAGCWLLIIKYVRIHIVWVAVCCVRPENVEKATNLQLDMFHLFCDRIFFFFLRFLCFAKHNNISSLDRHDSFGYELPSKCVRICPINSMGNAGIAEKRPTDIGACTVHSFELNAKRVKWEKRKMITKCRRKSFASATAWYSVFIVRNSELLSWRET